MPPNLESNNLVTATGTNLEIEIDILVNIIDEILEFDQLIQPI